MTLEERLESFTEAVEMTNQAGSRQLEEIENLTERVAELEASVLTLAEAGICADQGNLIMIDIVKELERRLDILESKKSIMEISPDEPNKKYN